VSGELRRVHDRERRLEHRLHAVEEKLGIAVPDEELAAVESEPDLFDEGSGI
jgi:hypothetical protein